MRTPFQQLVDGIEYLHKRQIMHRDLKPQNLMLKDQNNLATLRIVDFGMATSTEVEKFIFTRCGTPGYIAPEIANLKSGAVKYSVKCDVFSLGSIFYKL